MEDGNEGTRAPLSSFKHRDLSLGLPPGTERWVKRTTDEKFTPLVRKFALIRQVDLYPIVEGLYYDRILVFNALLITCHPEIREVAAQIRQSLGLKELLKYKKDLDKEGAYSNTTLAGLERALLDSLKYQLDYFFAGVGKNLQRDDWDRPIATWILTDYLLVSPDFTLPFEFFPKIIGQTTRQTENYPVLVIKERIKDGELEALITFIRESERDIVEITRQLPDPVVKRTDVDLTRLAAGLWMINRKSLKDNPLWGKVERSYLNYLHAMDFSADKENLRKLKQSADEYLNKLYPLKRTQ